MLAHSVFLKSFSLGMAPGTVSTLAGERAEGDSVSTGCGLKWREHAGLVRIAVAVNHVGRILLAAGGWRECKAPEVVSPHDLKPCAAPQSPSVLHADVCPQARGLQFREAIGRSHRFRYCRQVRHLALASGEEAAVSADGAGIPKLSRVVTTTTTMAVAARNAHTPGETDDKVILSPAPASPEAVLGVRNACRLRPSPKSASIPAIARAISFLTKPVYTVSTSADMAGSLLDASTRSA